MDLIVGSTGHVGKQIALRLAGEGRVVRALVRGGSRPETADLEDAGIQVFDGDLTKPDTLAAACEGVHTVVSTATSMPDAGDDGLRRVDLEGILALIGAAERTGVERFVYTSYSGNIEVESPLHTAKRGCEDRLQRSSLSAIILRPSFFMEVWLSPATGFDPARRTARVFGSGDSGISFISASDVADFAAAVVLEEGEEDQAPGPADQGDGVSRGRTPDATAAGGTLVLELGGPAPVSQLEAVRIFEDELEVEIAVDHVPIDMLLKQYATEDPLEKSFAALTLAFAEGDAIPNARETAERYGIELRSVRDYARRFAGRD